MSIRAAFSRTGVKSPSIVGERQNTGFSIRIATICLGHGFKTSKITALGSGLNPQILQLTAVAPLGQDTGCCEPTVTAMDPSQYTPRKDLVPQLCHSFTFFSKHILLQLGLNRIINAAPQGLHFPSAVIYNSLEIFLPYRTGIQITKTTTFSPLAPFSSISSADICYTYRGTPKWNCRAVPKISLDWTGTEQSHTYFLAADSVAQAGTKHLLAALCLEPLHTNRVHHSVISYALAIWLRLGLLRLRLVQRSLYVCEARRARTCRRTWERWDITCKAEGQNASTKRWDKILSTPLDWRHNTELP